MAVHFLLEKLKTLYSNTVGFDKVFFCVLYVGDYPHFGRD